MYNPYDLHYRSKQYRQERLAEARATHLEGQLREDRKASSGKYRLALALTDALAFLGVASQSGAGRARTWWGAGRSSWNYSRSGRKDAR